MYAGMKYDNSLMNEVEYFEKWLERWKETVNDLPAELKNPSDAELYLCNKFDFECYRAIVQYLYNLTQNRKILE
jgi:hypothetical protein